MSLTASSTFAVADAAIESGSAAVVILPAAAAYNPATPPAERPRGRLTHPTLGVYDYAVPPTEVVNLDGAVLVSPDWAHTKTLGGGVDALWSGHLRDPRVIERWSNGDTGGPIAHFRALYAFFANPPDPATGTPVVWAPSYATTLRYNVALVGLRVGGEEMRIDLRLARNGYVPPPLELELRVIGIAA